MAGKPIEIPLLAGTWFSSDVGVSMSEEEGISLLLQSLLGASSVLVYWDVSYSSCLMKLRLNILLIEHSSHAVNSLLRQKVSILKNMKMSFVLMSMGMECF